MALTYATHTKLSLKKHAEFNEAWLHDRICDDPAMLGLGDVRVLDRERQLPGGGRLDLLLFDEDNGRRYEVEIMLGATDPSHIVRTLEYWDAERRRYPGYDHVAVLIAEDITARFINVMALMAGSLPLIAVQLDALQVGPHVVLNFIKVLDQAELRIDDTDEDSGGGQTDRSYWEKRAGQSLMRVCDRVLTMINDSSPQPQELNYLKQYIGLKSNGVVRNVVSFNPKPTKKLVHIAFLSSDAADWCERFEEAGLSVRQGRRGRRYRVSVSASQLDEHEQLIGEAVRNAVGTADSD